jgi:Ca2+-binding EF-hand superfamily protein
VSQGKDSIDLNTNPRIKSSMEKNGDPIPANGILTKDQFKINFAKRVAQGGGRGGMSGGSQFAPAAAPSVVPGQPAMGGAPGGADFMESRFKEMDKNKDGFVTPDEASDRMKPMFAQFDTNGDGKVDVNEYKTSMSQRFSNGGGMMVPPQQEFNPTPSSGGRNRDRAEDEDTARVSVSRFGKLPKEVPGFFTEMDDDRDGMIGLYEWRRHGRKSAEFVEMDLNADGYLTADEWLRFSRIGIEKRDQESLAEKSPAERGSSSSRWSGSSAGGDRTNSDKGKATDRLEKGGKGGKDRVPGAKGRNPFVGGG